MRNLFLRAHELKHGRDDNPLGTGWEDTLTDAVAFYFASDAEGLARWVRLVLGEDAPEVVEIETQLAEGGDRPDIALHLADGSLLLMENKIEAAMGDRQLQRYLDMRGRNGRPALLCFVSLNARTLPDDVLHHASYRSAAGREHFFWQDIYGCIPEGGSALGLPRLRRCMRDYMGQLGLAPSSLAGEWQRLFEDRRVDENKVVQKAFGRELGGVRTPLSALGLRVTGVSHSGLAAATGAERGLLHLQVDPHRPHRSYLPPEALDAVANEVFRVALVWSADADESIPRAVFERAPRPLRTSMGAWWPTAPHRMSQNRIRLEFVVNLRPLLDGEAAIADRVAAAFAPMVAWLAADVPDLQRAGQ